MANLTCPKCGTDTVLKHWINKRKQHMGTCTACRKLVYLGRANGDTSKEDKKTAQEIEVIDLTGAAGAGVKSPAPARGTGSSGKRAGSASGAGAGKRRAAGGRGGAVSKSQSGSGAGTGTANGGGFSLSKFFDEFFKW